MHEKVIWWPCKIRNKVKMFSTCRRDLICAKKTKVNFWLTKKAQTFFPLINKFKCRKGIHLQEQKKVPSHTTHSQDGKGRDGMTRCKNFQSTLRQTTSGTLFVLTMTPKSNNLVSVCWVHRLLEEVFFFGVLMDT